MNLTLHCAVACGPSVMLALPRCVHPPPERWLITVVKGFRDLIGDLNRLLLITSFDSNCYTPTGRPPQSSFVSIFLVSINSPTVLKVYSWSVWPETCVVHLMNGVHWMFSSLLFAPLVDGLPFIAYTVSGQIPACSLRGGWIAEVSSTTNYDGAGELRGAVQFDASSSFPAHPVYPEPKPPTGCFHRRVFCPHNLHTTEELFYSISTLQKHS